MPSSDTGLVFFQIKNNLVMILIVSHYLTNFNHVSSHASVCTSKLAVSAFLAYLYMINFSS